MDLIGNNPANKSASTDAATGSKNENADNDQSRELDQFYTHPDIAADCLAKAREHIKGDVATWLEPSAGTGAFLKLLPTPRVGLDIDPQHPEVLHANFLTWKKGEMLARPVVTIGNPPFGKNSSLAIQFINEATRFSDWICMILPRTFEKSFVQNKVNRHFDLVKTYPIQPDSFIYRGEPYNVPCCFQIWKRLPTTQKRDLHYSEMTHPHFSFVDKPSKADFAFQRVGVNAGRASIEGLDKSYKSNHFIKASDGVNPEDLMRDLNSIDWKVMSEKTAGNPSIGKGEMIAAYSIIHPPGKKPGMLDFGGTM
jgi:predicted RNA methylase